MKPNGKYFAVRALFLTLCAVSLLSTLGSAEVLRGKFKLTTETYWGKLLLAPGEYEFAVADGEGPSAMLTVRSSDSLWSGMVLAEGVSGAKPAESTRLVLEKSASGTFVRALCLADSGLTLTYAMPKPGKFVRLAKQPVSSNVASASGGQ